ncbi:MAG: hypothetical protein HON94_11460 [Methylococcales bacterium]|jgi:acyl carrier protein|nr:hypothetical protein [Methylococcales bacterium]MBT7408336.1 hypothetical protein [Methylococcales bacterium]
MPLNEIYNIVYESIDQFNEINERNLEKSPDTVLFGAGGHLESIELVTLIIEIEDNIDDQLDHCISIVSEKAMSQSVSPFQTIETLVNYIQLIITEGDN